MTQPLAASDNDFLKLLRQVGPLSVAQLSRQIAVTPTAVRQRLNRLMGEGLVCRQLHRGGRGRPLHQYSLTEKGLRATGSNYADLVLVLWQEIRQVQDVQVRRGLLKRIAEKLAQTYKNRVGGTTLRASMHSLQELLAERNVPVAVDESEDLPVLNVLACPYPVLAEQDRSVCDMEQLLFSNLLGERLQLTECRLDGTTCCTFEVH